VGRPERDRDVPGGRASVAALIDVLGALHMKIRGEVG
jgi:hypothetical protein